MSSDNEIAQPETGSSVQPAQTPKVVAQPSLGSLPNKLAGLSAEQKAQVILGELQRNPNLLETVKVTMMRSHSGPLPAPEDLVGYERCHPGAADRIIRMAEKAQDNFHQLARRELDGNFREARIGQICGFIIGLVGVGGGIACVMTGHTLAGSGISFVSLVALVTVFVRGRAKATADE